jgi:hypothetical protein
MFLRLPLADAADRILPAKIGSVQRVKQGFMQRVKQTNRSAPCRGPTAKAARVLETQYNLRG